MLAFIRFIVYNEGMKVGIFYKKEKVRNEALIEELKGLLSKGGNEAVVFARAEEIDGVDRLIVLGGDGTILRAAHALNGRKIPMVGVNYGTLGFLTEFERADVYSAVDLILDENCQTVSRSMLEIDWNGTKTHCLNEMVITRESSVRTGNKIARLSVTLDGTPAGDFVADGIIVATPTGSTAYSLSAGGNIMCPDCKTFLITPICAFSLRSRPIVYSDESVLSFQLNEPQPMVLYGDGKFLGEFHSGTLSVRKSDKSVYFLTRNKNGFFRRLTEKIG